MLEAYLLACLVGAVAETAARLGRFWLYRRPLYPVFNVRVMFGLIMGAVALAVPAWGPLAVFSLAALIGYAYEQLNFGLLDWWYFPDDRFLLFRGRQACALSVAVLWGLTPLAVHRMAVVCC